MTNYHSVNFKTINYLKFFFKIILMNLNDTLLAKFSKKFFIKKKGYNNWENFYFTGEKYYIEKILVNTSKNYDYVIDIGANVGEWSELVLKTNLETSVIAFEPQHECKEKLINLANKYKNFRFIMNAISNTNDYQNIYYEIAGSQLASMIKSKNVFSNYKQKKILKYQSNKVKSITISNLYKKIKIKKKHKVFIKIDVEGLEHKILNEIINKDLNYDEIIFELNPINAKKIFNLLYKARLKINLFRLLPFNNGLREVKLHRNFFNKNYCNLLIKRIK